MLRISVYAGPVTVIERIQPDTISYHHRHYLTKLKLNQHLCEYFSLKNYKSLSLTM